MKKYKLWICCLFATSVFAQSDSTKFSLTVELPLIDLNANSKHHFLSFRQLNPSMQQSLSLTKSLVQGEEYLLDRAFFKPGKKYSKTQRIKRLFGFYLSDAAIQFALMSKLPLGGAWLHEEWHRSVLTRHGIKSKNGINQLEFGSDKVAVNGLSDESLTNLKLYKPHDFTRLAVGGIEAQYEFNHSLQWDHFYNNLGSKSEVAYWTNFLSAMLYVQSSAKLKDDEIIKEENKEGNNPLKRDFIGYDFTAWVYDLHRPNEDYSQRGTHPSGSGIRRYIKVSDLSNDEKKYLERIGNMQWLNTLNPFMFGFNSFKINETTRFNANAFHYLNSFGYDVGARVFLERNNKQYFLAVHNYNNKHRSFWGAEATINNIKVLNKWGGLNLSPTLHLWAQPEKLSFYDRKAKLGGRAEFTLSKFGDQKISPFCTVVLKTKGWVAGNVYQDENISFRAGMKLRL